MGTRSDSYSSTGEVRAFTRHLLDAQSTFNSTTQPTLTEVEKFIDRASGVLNLALSGKGLTTPVSNTTAKLACDDWVTERAVEYVELTQRGVGYSDGEGSRVASFRNLQKSAAEFAAINRLGFVRLGVTQTDRASDGLQFTGLDAHADRSDPSDTGLEQPLFTRHQFDEPSASRFTADEDDDD